MDSPLEKQFKVEINRNKQTRRLLLKDIESLDENNNATVTETTVTGKSKPMHGRSSKLTTESNCQPEKESASKAIDTISKTINSPKPVRQTGENKTTPKKVDDDLDTSEDVRLPHARNDIAISVVADECDFLSDQEELDYEDDVAMEDPQTGNTDEQFLQSSSPLTSSNVITFGTTKKRAWSANEGKSWHSAHCGSNGKWEIKKEREAATTSGICR